MIKNLGEGTVFFGRKEQTNHYHVRIIGGQLKKTLSIENEMCDSKLYILQQVA
jgi:hypothetical protein